MASNRPGSHLRYEPNEPCSPLLALLVGVQGTLIGLPITVMVVVIVGVAGGQSEGYVAWTMFGSLIILAAVTALQASRIWRFGAGHTFISVISPTFIAVSILALEAGGPTLLVSLLLVSAVCYLAVPTWLPLLRRIITPAVSGTVLMLISVSILPVTLDVIGEAPEGTSPAAGLYVVAATLVVSTLLTMRAPGRWRAWSLVIGIGCGCAIAAPFGFYELESLYAASWVGFPGLEFPGLDLTPPAEFWAMAPMFAIVALVFAVKGIGDAVAVQQASRRQPRATDFRMLQGTLYANGISMFASALIGILPPTFFSSMTVSVVTLTGVASRYVGYAMAVILLALALSPKLASLFLLIPGPVLGAVLLIAIGIFFVQGIQSVMQDGIDVSKTFIVGLSFATGAAMEFQNVFEGLIPSPWDLLLGNGVTMGGLMAVGLTAFMELSRSRPRRLTTRLEFSELPRIDTFLQDVAGRMGWNEASTDRLRSAGEEAISSLLQPDNEFAETESQGNPPRLMVSARPDGRAVDLEFISVLEEENLGDRLSYLEEEPQVVDEREVSFRLLRHYASTVRHQKYHGMDIIMVRVES
ncbi:MAG: hypothetical protein F4W95_02155 [Chloroflexi bacterium]|nr:hypothetical protein [Chloroflexota bacterium]MYD47268.1 hypothetical protein [Chloroflexota bacterium]